MEPTSQIVYLGATAPAEVVQGLRAVGGRVAVVETGAECLARLSNASCVVATRPTPETDLVDLCTRIRERRPDVPIVFVPADGSETLAGELLAAGADGYVPHAAGVDTLTTRVRELLEGTATPDADGALRPSCSSRNGRAALESRSGSDSDPDTGEAAVWCPLSGASAADPAERLELLVDRSPLAIIEWTPEFEVASWNSAATDLFGYTDAEARGEHALDLLVPDANRAEVLEHWEQLVDGVPDSPAWRVNRNVRKDGSTITCEWFDAPLFDDGELAGILSFAQDVTAERKRANALESLQETTQRLMRAESVCEITSIVIAATEHVTDRSLAALRLYDDETGLLELAAATPTLDENTSDLGAIGPTDTVLWKAYTNGEPRTIDDVSTVQIPPDLETTVGTAVVHPLGDHGLLTVASSGDDELGNVEQRLVHVLAATAEAALDRAERERELERTETIVETVGDSVYALDRDGTLVTVNDRLTAVTGYSRDELVGEHVSTVLTDESLERGRKRIRALVSADADFVATYEITLVTREGDHVPCEVNTTLLQTDGTLEGTVGIVRDIGDRKRMERELVDRKAKIEGLHEVASQLDDCESREDIYELTVEAAEDVLNFDVCVVDRVEDGYLVEAARSSTLDGNVTRRMRIEEGIAGKTYRTQETYRIDDIRTDSAAAPQNEEFRSALSVPIGDWGVFQTVSTEIASFTREDEELAELLLSHVTDALDRIAFEEQLRTERDRFAALFENVPDGVVSARESDGEAIIESVNPAFEHIFGYDEATLVDEPLDRFIVPADRASEAEAITRRGSMGETIEAEVKRRTSDGLRDFMMRVVPVERNESSSRAFGLYTDITDQKQRQKRVEILNRVLRHDMRNSMNIIDGCAEMLAEAVEDDAAEYAAAIQTRATELVELAEKTRAVERVLERESATTGPIDIATVVSGAASRLEDDYPGVEVSCSIPERLFVRADASLETAIYQILENAVEHNDASTPTVAITACGRTDDGLLSVSIADNGPGIPDEERELLQGDREITQLRHASGLGLWLVTLVVTQFGGQLAFETNEPRGTVVSLEMPRADAELANATGDSTVAGD
ncbi:PAS domain S-box protein [Natronorubrum halophilum]|uniref:PAS domain S-box protein n=1 Tax=Natronorubrum halophilum TaxID=1702106 RepID=UPI0010C17D3C|nr:PAS domain S-box protein [Natronorubrum halophilum]